MTTVAITDELSHDAEFQRICSSRVVGDIDDLRAEPEKFLEAIKEQRRGCLNEVLAIAKAKDLDHIRICPLDFAIRSVNFQVEFYLYTTLSLREEEK